MYDAEIEKKPLLPKIHPKGDFLFKGHMDEDKVYLTREGLENLKKEYEALTRVKRPVAVERLQATRVIGELVENSDYTQAKQDLSYIDGRISELEQVLGKAELINEDKGGHKQVGLGCRVTVEIHGKKGIFHLVGEWEADPLHQKISHESPLGRALLGKKVGDKIEVEAPVGKLIYTVLEIE